MKVISATVSSAVGLGSGPAKSILGSQKRCLVAEQLPVLSAIEWLVRRSGHAEPNAGSVFLARLNMFVAC